METATWAGASSIKPTFYSENVKNGDVSIESEIIIYLRNYIREYRLYFGSKRL